VKPVVDLHDNGSMIAKIGYSYPGAEWKNVARCRKMFLAEYFAVGGFPAFELVGIEAGGTIEYFGWVEPFGSFLVSLRSRFRGYAKYGEQANAQSLYHWSDVYRSNCLSNFLRRDRLIFL
jgi:hypothetical protein